MSGRQYHAAWITDDGKTGEAGAYAALFPWWSYSKTMLAACALRLVERKAVELNTALPGQTYSLRQLLNHTAGVPNYGGLASYHEAVARGDRPWPRERLLQEVGADRLCFVPGQGWLYSNVGYMYVRELIEGAYGGNLEAALQDLVLAAVTAPSVRVAMTPSDFTDVHWSDIRGYDPGWVYHGCLLGSARDAARTLHALFKGRVLSDESLKSMQARYPLGDAVSGRPWVTHGYALGLMSGEMDGVGRAVGHSGGGPGCVNAVYRFPDLPSPVTVAVFTDGSDEGAAEFEARDIALKSQIPSVDDG